MSFKIDEDISLLESRIKELNNLRKSINNHYETAIKENSLTQIWHDSLNLITKKYMLYLNGSV